MGLKLRERGGNVVIDKIQKDSAADVDARLVLVCVRARVGKMCLCVRVSMIIMLTEVIVPAIICDCVTAITVACSVVQCLVVTYMSVLLCCDVIERIV